MGKVKQMNKRELAKLRKWTDTLTDEELKKEYYESMFDCEEYRRKFSKKYKPHKPKYKVKDGA